MDDGVLGMGIRAALMALALLALQSPAAALAEPETVIGFDDQPVDTQIESQYAAQGVTFNETPTGLHVRKSAVVAPSGGEAHSPPNVLDVSQGCGSEFPEVQLWGRFAAPRNHVELFVGRLNTGSSLATNVALEGFDLAGNPIPGAKDQVTISGFGLNTEMGIQSSESEISFFRLSSSGLCTIGIDDLTFDAVPALIPADFALSGPSPGPVLTAGTSQTVPLRLHRTLGSTGPISFAVSGQPIGVSAVVTPSSTNGLDGTPLELILTAAPNAQPFHEAPIKVTGTPSLTAGEHQRSVTIPVSVVGNYDLRAQGLEVTQGVQGEGTLRPEPTLGGNSGGAYQGVHLIAHKRTAVRFFADAHGAIGSGVSPVGALLFGFRDGRELPESPIHPDFAPAKLVSVQENDPAPVLEAERKSEANAFTFTLPPSWDSGTDELVAHVYREPTFPSPNQAPAECSSTACQANDSFALHNITFNPTQNVMLTTVALESNGKLPGSVSSEMQGPKLVTPLAEPGWNFKNPNDGFTVLPYEGTIDISSIINGSGKEKNEEIRSLVDQWASDMGHPNYGTMGIAPGNEFRSVTSAGRDTSAVVSSPVVISHELFHMLRLDHASVECGGGTDGDSDDEGQQGTPWPLKPGDNEDAVEAPFLGPTSTDTDFPTGFQDGFGQLLGIGLDMRTAPYAILGDGLHSVPEFYDFMSYCQGSQLGEKGDWVSPINWEAVYHHFALASSSSAGGAQGSAAASKAAGGGGAGGPVADLHPGRLRVLGYVSRNGFNLDAVGPQVGPPLSRGSSGFVLEAFDAHGKKLATAPMSEGDGHIDHGGPLNPVTGEVAAHGAARIAVLDNGSVVASRSRPKHRPRVRILSPRAGSRVGGGGSVKVRWRAGGRHSRSLVASVDYSRDGGRNWRTISVGANTGHLKLPAFYFASSRRAKVRVRVNDGFDEGVAVSGLFTATGSPPRVSIAKPPAVIPGDVPVQLSGQAVDENMRVLGGRHMRWFDGRFAIGSGPQISAGTLPAGKNHIRLVATDAAGRTGSAHVSVTVKQVKLPFLKLGVPKAIAGAARTLVLKARSAVPAKIAIGKRKFKLKALHKEKLRLPVKPGVPLLLHLSVTAGGAQTPFAVAVKRR
jgi:hypothetical protein